MHILCKATQSYLNICHALNLLTFSFITSSSHSHLQIQYPLGDTRQLTNCPSVSLLSVTVPPVYWWDCKHSSLMICRLMYLYSSLCSQTAVVGRGISSGNRPCMVPVKSSCMLYMCTRKGASQIFMIQRILMSSCCKIKNPMNLLGSSAVYIHVLQKLIRRYCTVDRGYSVPGLFRFLDKRRTIRRMRDGIRTYLHVTYVNCAHYAI